MVRRDTQKPLGGGDPTGRRLIVRPPRRESVTSRTRLTTVESVPENGSWLFTVRESDGDRQEVILVRACDGVEAWKNFCQHETDQRLDLGSGAAVRDEDVVCPKHGSVFDGCSGYCDNGPAAGSTLASVDVDVDDGAVYLTDDDATFAHEGGLDEAGDEGESDAENAENADGGGDGGDDGGDEDDGDGGPSSTSHLRF
jgi:nitrite reductase/ring-hydroxylating ferredoxin subunit